MEKSVSPDVIFKLAKAKSLEEFTVIKDLHAVKKSLNASETIELLKCMAAQQHDSRLAKALIQHAGHVTVNNDVLNVMHCWAYSGSLQPYIVSNLKDMLFEIERDMLFKLERL